MKKEIWINIDSSRTYDNKEEALAFETLESNVIRVIEYAAYEELKEALRRTNSKLNKAGVRFTYAEKFLKE